MMRLLTAFPGKAVHTILALWILAGLVARFFLGTAVGMLLAAILLWVLAPGLFEVKPFTPGQLVEYIADLPDTYKVGIISSLLTVAGFLVSFNLGFLNWRRQQRLELQMAIADEIESFVADFGNNSRDLAAIARVGIDTMGQLLAVPRQPAAAFSLGFFLSKVPDALKARARIQEMHIEVYRLGAKHYVFLSTIWGAHESFARITEAIRLIATALAPIPEVKPDDPRAEAAMFAVFKIDRWHNFVTTADRELAQMHGHAGSLRGQLQAPIIGFNLPALAHFIQIGTQFRGAMDKLRATKTVMASSGAQRKPPTRPVAPHQTPSENSASTSTDHYAPPK